MQIQPHDHSGAESVRRSLGLGLQSTRNEHICLLAGKALILCNVAPCHLRGKTPLKNASWLLAPVAAIRNGCGEEGHLTAEGL